MNIYNRHYRLDSIKSIICILAIIIIPTVVVYADLIGYYFVFVSIVLFTSMIYSGIHKIAEDIYNVSEYDKHHKDIE